MPCATLLDGPLQARDVGRGDDAVGLQRDGLLVPSSQILGLPRPSMIVTCPADLLAGLLDRLAPPRDASFCSSPDRKTMCLPGSGLGELVGPSQVVRGFVVSMTVCFA